MIKINMKSIITMCLQILGYTSGARELIAHVMVMVSPTSEAIYAVRSDRNKYDKRTFELDF